MSSTKQTPRPLRTLIVLGVLIVVAFGALLAGTKWSEASLMPNLALDLEGGTQVILTPVTTDGSKVTDADISEAIKIIRQRVDSSGVSEAEIASQGGNNIVVGLPGRPSEETLELVRHSAQMNFRPVLQARSSLEDWANLTEEEQAEYFGEAAEDTDVDPTDGDEVIEDGGTDVDLDAAADAESDANADSKESSDEATGHDTPAPSNPSDLTQITPEIREEFDALRCFGPDSLVVGRSADPNKPLVTCESTEDEGLESAITREKYILGPVEIAGTEITRASSGLSTRGNVTTNDWVVSLEFNRDGSKKFAETTRRLAEQNLQGNQGADVAPNRFAMTLDGLVISAPSVTETIPNGQAQISGTFTRESSEALANQLNFGALPLTFEVQSEQEISATLGSEQLEKGLIAGAIGLLAVVIYSLFQYRVLGLVTVASLSIAAVVTYIAIALLSWTQGFRLSLPGVAGVIVAIGITADSFIVYFERIRDELRDGSSLAIAIDKGWDRAKRTILASDTVNFLAAIVLYFLAVGGVRGFAFTLGLTTLVDLLVVFCFTHPLLKLVSKTKFFSSGHSWSGLDPRRLGVRSARYVGRGQVATAASRSGQASAEDAEATTEDVTQVDQDRVPALTAPAPAYDVDGRRLTIAERRAAAAAAARGAAEPDSDKAKTDGEPAQADDEETL